MTMVTAMVSPSARARARNTEPRMPVRAQGTTTFQVASQRVAPSASAASRCSRGTVSKHFARNGDDERHDHDRQNDSGGQEIRRRSSGP